MPSCPQPDSVFAQWLRTVSSNKIHANDNQFYVFWVTDCAEIAYPGHRERG